MPEGVNAYLRDYAIASTGENEDRELLDEVLPYVESKYKVARRAEARAIAGASSGAFRAFDQGMRHLDMFSAIGMFSNAPGVAAWRNTTFHDRFANALADVAATNERLRLLWMACGEKDSLCEPSQRQPMPEYDLLTKAGIKYTRVVTPGGHTWLNWRRYLRDFASQLFQ